MRCYYRIFSLYIFYIRYIYILFIIYYQKIERISFFRENGIRIMLRCVAIRAITVMEDLSNFLSRGDPGNLRNRA